MKKEEVHIIHLRHEETKIEEKMFSCVLIRIVPVGFAMNVI